MVTRHCVDNFRLSWDLSQWTESEEWKYITLCSNFRFSSNLFQWTETEQCWASQIWNTSHCVQILGFLQTFSNKLRLKNAGHHKYFTYLQENDIRIIMIFSSLFQGPSEHSHAFKTKYLHMFTSMMHMYIDQWLGTQLPTEIGRRSDASIQVW